MLGAGKGAGIFDNTTGQDVKKVYIYHHLVILDLLFTCIQYTNTFNKHTMNKY